jgi:hypothetical protein
MGLCLIDANNLLNRAVIFVLIQLKPVDDVFVIVIVFVLVRNLPNIYTNVARKSYKNGARTSRGMSAHHGMLLLAPSALPHVTSGVLIVTHQLNFQQPLFHAPNKEFDMS